MENIRIQIPAPVEQIVSVLSDAGHESFVVGGCVRDAVMGIEPHDWDICASPEPQEVMRVMRSAGYQVIEMGVEHGVIAVVVDGVVCEIASFRGDGNYSDGRRPDNVVFGVSIEEDLARRDFRMNAMAYNHERGLVDPFGGMRDIQNRIISAVGNPQERFQEDALRMLRAIRFASRFGFEIHWSVVAAIAHNAGLIRNVSIERIQSEVVQIIESDNPVYLRDMFHLGLAQFFMGDIHGSDINWYALRHAQSSAVRLAIVFRNRTDIMRQMRFENADIREVERIHDALSNYRLVASDFFIRSVISRVGLDVFWKMVEAREAMGQNNVVDIRRIADEIVERGDCISLAQMAVNGHDVMELGYSGKAIGQVLDNLLIAVVSQPEMNNRESLLEIARNMEME